MLARWVVLFFSLTRPSYHDFIASLDSSHQSTNSKCLKQDYKLTGRRDIGPQSTIYKPSPKDPTSCLFLLFPSNVLIPNPKRMLCKTTPKRQEKKMHHAYTIHPHATFQPMDWATSSRSLWGKDTLIHRNVPRVLALPGLTPAVQTLHTDVLAVDGTELVLGCVPPGGFDVSCVAGCWKVEFPVEFSVCSAALLAGYCAASLEVVSESVADSWDVGYAICFDCWGTEEANWSGAPGGLGDGCEGEDCCYCSVGEGCELHLGMVWLFGWFEVLRWWVRVEKLEAKVLKWRLKCTTKRVCKWLDWGNKKDRKD